MPTVRSLITTFFTGDVPRDYCSNTIHHTITGGVVWNDPDYQNHAAEVLAAFTGGASDAPDFVTYAPRNVQVRVYDLDDPEPRPERGYAQHLSDGGQRIAPSELAVVLSYYCGRNIPGMRGRIFVGPWAGNLTGEFFQYRPTDPMRTAALHLGHALFGIGGENVAHVLWHPKATKSGHAAGSTNVVTTYDVADAWGVVHSRGPRATNRMTLSP